MKFVTLVILVFSAVHIFSQSDSIKVFELHQMRIYHDQKGDIISYQFDSDTNKFTLTQNTLFTQTVSYKYKFKLKNITTVAFRNGSHAWGTAAVTGTIGFVLGFLAGGYFTMHGTPKFTFSHAMVGGLVVGAPFAFVGGLIGLLFHKYDYYYLSEVPDRLKYEYLKRTFKKQQQRR